MTWNQRNKFSFFTPLCSYLFVSHKCPHISMVQTQPFVTPLSGVVVCKCSQSGCTYQITVVNSVNDYLFHFFQVNRDEQQRVFRAARCHVNRKSALAGREFVTSVTRRILECLSKTGRPLLPVTYHVVQLPWWPFWHQTGNKYRWKLIIGWLNRICKLLSN